MLPSVKDEADRGVVNDRLTLAGEPHVKDSVMVRTERPSRGRRSDVTSQRDVVRVMFMKEGGRLRTAAEDSGRTGLWT